MYITNHPSCCGIYNVVDVSRPFTKLDLREAWQESDDWDGAELSVGQVLQFTTNTLEVGAEKSLEDLGAERSFQWVRYAGTDIERTVTVWHLVWKG